MACAVVALRALLALAGDTFRYDRFSRDAAVALKQACLWADSSKLAVALHAARDAGVVGSEVIRGESSLNATVELRCAFSSRALQTAQEAGKPTLTLSLAGLLALKRRDSADSNDVNRITAALTRWKGLGEGQLDACLLRRTVVSLCAHGVSLTQAPPQHARGLALTRGGAHWHLAACAGEKAEANRARNARGSRATTSGLLATPNEMGPDWDLAAGVLKRLKLEAAESKMALLGACEATHSLYSASPSHKQWRFVPIRATCAVCGFSSMQLVVQARRPRPGRRRQAV